MGHLLTVAEKPVNQSLAHSSRFSLAGDVQLSGFESRGSLLNTRPLGTAAPVQRNRTIRQLQESLSRQRGFESKSR